MAAADRARPLGRFAAAAFLATDHQTNKQTNERTDRRRHRVYPSLMRRGLKNQKIFAFSFLEMRSCQILQEYMLEKQGKSTIVEVRAQQVLACSLCFFLKSKLYGVSWLPISNATAIYAKLSKTQEWVILITAQYR